MNIENFKLVLEKIKSSPCQWDQSAWHSSCGTKHCIAGWAQILGGAEANSETARMDARIFLDLTMNEANFIFSSSRQMSDFDRIVSVAFDSDGYDREGYDRGGYDRFGYGRDGYDMDGLDKNNKPRNK